MPGETLEFKLDETALANAILYVVERVADPDRHRTLKMLYLADKLHLERYGSPITGDRYIKMRFGPVASAAYDAMKALADERNWANEKLTALLRGKLNVADRRLSATESADLMELSPSMVECLDAAIAEYDDLSFGEMTDVTHDEAWEAAEPNRPIPPEAIINTLEDSDLLLEFVTNPH